MVNAFGSLLCSGTEIVSLKTHHLGLRSLEPLGGEILRLGVTLADVVLPPVDVSGALGYAEPATLHSGTAG